MTVTTNGDRRTAAADQYRASVTAGRPLNARELGEQFDRSRSWGRAVIAEVKAADRSNGASNRFVTGSQPAAVEPVAADVSPETHTTVAATGERNRSPENNLPSPAPEPAATGQPEVATWQARVTGLAVVVVAGVAAVLSYSHMRSLALAAGEGVWQATLLPLSVDGLMTAASMTALVRKRSGQPVGALPWLALLLGVAASMAANIASAQPTIEGRLVAAWPPLALLVSLEMLLRQTRTSR